MDMLNSLSINVDIMSVIAYYIFGFIKVNVLIVNLQNEMLKIILTKYRIRTKGNHLI